MPDLRTHSWEMTSTRVFRAAFPVRLCPDDCVTLGRPFPVTGLGFLLDEMRGLGLTPPPHGP